MTTTPDTTAAPRVFHSYREYEQAMYPNRERERILQHGSPAEVADLFVEEALTNLRRSERHTSEA